MDKFHTDGWLIDELFQFGTVPVTWPLTSELPIDGMFFIESGSQSILVERIVSDTADCLVSRHYLLNDRTCWGVSGRSAEQKIALNVLMDTSIPCVSLVGLSGSGKTLLAIASALQQRKEYLKILICRPIVSLNNSHKLGYIPGSLDDKLAPWCAPLMDNIAVLKEIKDRETIERMLNEKKIQMTPLETIRGRSLYRTFMIVDEAQNLEIDEIKTIGTRLGEGSKLVFTADLAQIDRKELRGGKDGLTEMIQKTKHSPLTAVVKLVKGERSPLSSLFAECL